MIYPFLVVGSLFNNSTKINLYQDTISFKHVMVCDSVLVWNTQHISLRYRLPTCMSHFCYQFLTMNMHCFNTQIPVHLSDLTDHSILCFDFLESLNFNHKWPFFTSLIRYLCRSIVINTERCCYIDFTIQYELLFFLQNCVHKQLHH